MRKSVLSILLLLVCGLTPAGAGLVVEPEGKLLADDGGPRDGFGARVAVDGDTVVVGALDDDDNGTDSGSAYVFVRTAGGWTQQARLLPYDGSEGDRFGVAVAVVGDTILVGAERDQDNGFFSGSAYVFTRTAGVWEQQAKLLPGDGSPGDRFGLRVAMDGDTAVIAAPNDDDGGDLSGSVYVFVRAAGVWMQQAKLMPDDPAERDFFGGAVAVQRDTIVIGAEGDDDNGPSSGSACVFTRAGGLWTRRAKLTADDGADFDLLGTAVALDGDTIVVGAGQDDDNGDRSGSAYVFVGGGATWEQQAKLLPDEGTEGDQFGGIGVALQGDTVVIGAPGHDALTGSAYAFVRTAGIWEQRASIVPDDAEQGDFFGFSASLDGETVALGAVGDDDRGDQAGAAHVFRLNPDPVCLLNALIEEVRALELHRGTERSLLAKLEAALALLTDVVDGNDHAARSVLGAFMRQVRAQRGKKIPTEAADGLVAEARRIAELLTEGGGTRRVLRTSGPRTAPGPTARR